MVDDIDEGEIPLDDFVKISEKLISEIS